MTRPTTTSDDPEWLELVHWCNSSLDHVAALADRFAASAATGARTQTRLLFDEALRAFALVLDGRRVMSPSARMRTRAIGAALTARGLTVDALIGQLGQLTSLLSRAVLRAGHDDPPVDPELIDRAGHTLVRELLIGSGNQTDRASAVPRIALTRSELVECLVESGMVPPEAATDRQLASAYLVAVVEASPDRQRRVVAALAARSADVLTTACRQGVVALVPELSPARTGLLATELTGVLGALPGDRLRGAVAHRSRAHLPAAYREARELLALSHAVGSPPGLYRREDFLVEYAVFQNEDVARRLVRIIEPVMSSEVLRETLEAVLRADFNRSRAARDLFVHRSTLDYRLHRIEELTGHSPTSARGAHLLGAAVTMYAMRDSRQPMPEFELANPLGRAPRP
jgi:hypothetical protein